MPERGGLLVGLLRLCFCYQAGLLPEGVTPAAPSRPHQANSNLVRLKGRGEGKAHKAQASHLVCNMHMQLGNIANYMSMNRPCLFRVVLEVSGHLLELSICTAAQQTALGRSVWERGPQYQHIERQVGSSLLHICSAKIA